jgi:transcriptional regulator with XRE-family HTH domain
VRRCLSGATIERARQRRVALRRFIDRQGLNLAELARRMGFSNGNAITNFLNGRTESLAVGTLEKIARAFPGTTLEELTSAIGSAQLAVDRLSAGTASGVRLPASATLKLDLRPLFDELRTRTDRPATVAIEATITLIWPRDAAHQPR